ncbi:MAG: hypothetical protein RMJ51_04300 [Candidatus Calescibacterium sp.]|nr:hypothetical protein [Candidatus Calescibacterium sp.]MCX7971973.1 hypothetical protein [bacterium]MDW8195441.1 hypothetical protein [Candidatus Calescibacterium sp.]
MYSELMNKFLENSDDIVGIIIADREKEIPIEYSLKKNLDISEVNEISKAIAKSLKAYESTKSKSDLITMIFNTNDFSIVVDDYQDNNRILIILFEANRLAVKYAARNAKYLAQIIEKIKTEK